MKIITEEKLGSLTKNEKIQSFSRLFGIFMGLFLLSLTFSFLTPNFFTSRNIINIALQTSIAAIVAIGQTFVITGGGIDLSVGSVTALTGVIVALLLKAGLAMPLAIIISLFFALFLGMINGLVITQGKIAPFIATLGMNSILRGVVYVVTDGGPISNLPIDFGLIGGGYFQDFLPYAVIIMIVVSVIMGLILHKSRFGRYVFAVGSNEKTAYLSGLNVQKIKILMYSVCGLMAGVAGVVLTSRMVTAAPTAAVMYETDAIAATVIGGASLSGGAGSIPGTIIGSFIMGVLRNGLNLVGLNYFWQQIAIGVVIIVAVYIDSLRNKVKNIR